MTVQIDATFPRDPSAPAEARARAAALALGLQDELAEDVGRLASELVADGVRTGDVEEIHLALRLASGHVRVEVKAGERAARRFLVESPTLETALARTMVERLADRWGAERDRSGWMVWAEIAASPASEPRLEPGSMGNGAVHPTEGGSHERPPR